MPNPAILLSASTVVESKNFQQHWINTREQDDKDCSRRNPLTVKTALKNV